MNFENLRWSLICPGAVVTIGAYQSFEYGWVRIGWGLLALGVLVNVVSLFIKEEK